MKQCVPKRTFYCLKLFTFSFLSLASVGAQDIQSVIDIALKNNPRVKAQQQLVTKAKLETKASFRETLPDLNFDASYNHVTDVPEIQIPLIGNTIRMGTFDKFETGLTANYVLFSGFAQKNMVQLKKETEKLQGIGLLKTKKQTAFGVIAAYRQVQSLVLETKILNTAKERLNLQLNASRSLVENGMILAIDTLSLNIAILDYEKKIIKLESDLITAKQELQNLVGQAVSVSNAIPSPSDKGLPPWQGENISELKSFKVQGEMARTFTRLSNAANYPSIALQAAYRYGKPGLDMISNEWMHYGVWGIGINWNLFRGMSDALKTDAAKAEEKRITYLTNAASEQIQLEYNKSLNEYNFLLKQLSVTEQALKLAEEKMNIVKTHYQQGMATVTDFNSANLELTEAQLGKSRLLLLISLKFNEVEYKSGKPISEWSLTK